MINPDKLAHVGPVADAWAVIRERGPEAVFIFTGLDHSLPMTGEELQKLVVEVSSLPPDLLQKVRTAYGVH